MTDLMDQTLNIYYISEGSYALGPGLRYVIWVQGCMQNCKGCISPQSRPMIANHLIRIETLANSIINNRKIDGVTISGGEPFLQASKLALLLQIVKAKRPELNIIVFSGYQLKQLDPDKVNDFIQYIDLLIDGPYVDELNDEKGMRGSSNQQFHYFTDKLIPFKKELENGGRNNEMVINNEEIHIIGIPRKDIKPVINS